MPYVICSECGVTTYSAALWSGTEECPSCGRTLPVRRTRSRRLARSAEEARDEPRRKDASPPAA